MHCRAFEDHLDRLLAGELSAKEVQAAERHLRICARCRRLHELSRGPSAVEGVQPPAGLVQAVLERTTGPVCGFAEDRLCAWADELPADDHELVTRHLDHCTRCAALARELRGLGATLPGLAEIRPDDDFVRDVMMATAFRAKRPAFDEFLSALGASWRRLLQRRRFAWEAAYLGALLFLLVFISFPGNVRAVPRATAVPDLLVSGRDRMVQMTDALFEKKRATLRRALAELGVLGKAWMKKAAGIAAETGSAVERRAAALLGDLNPDSPDAGRRTNPPGNHR